MSDIRRRRPELLEMVGLRRWGRTLVRKYSKGMMQRLGLAQAMLHDPELLILDEPTDGVDPVGRAEIRDILGRLKSQGKTIFLNSHLLQEIELVCDRVAILGQGKLRRMDSVEAIRRLTSPEAVLTVRAGEALVRRGWTAARSSTCNRSTPITCVSRSKLPIRRTLTAAWTR